MLGILMIAFLVVPIIELYLFVEVSSAIGFGYALLWIVGVSVVGAWLAIVLCISDSRPDGMELSNLTRSTCPATYSSRGTSTCARAFQSPQNHGATSTVKFEKKTGMQPIESESESDLRHGESPAGSRQNTARILSWRGPNPKS